MFFELSKDMEVDHSLADVLVTSWMQLLPTGMTADDGTKYKEVSLLRISDTGLF